MAWARWRCLYDKTSPCSSHNHFPYAPNFHLLPLVEQYTSVTRVESPLRRVFIHWNGMQSIQKKVYIGCCVELWLSSNFVSITVTLSHHAILPSKTPKEWDSFQWQEARNLWVETASLWGSAGLRIFVRPAKTSWSKSLVRDSLIVMLILWAMSMNRYELSRYSWGNINVECSKLRSRRLSWEEQLLFNLYHGDWLWSLPFMNLLLFRSTPKEAKGIQSYQK